MKEQDYRPTDSIKESLNAGIEVTSIVFSSTFRKVKPILIQQLESNIMPLSWESRRKP